MRTPFAVLDVVMAALCFASSDVRAALATYVSPEDLAASSPLVLEGDVVRTASGYDPETQALATYITLDVTTVHRGPQDLERVVIRQPGGRHGSVVHEVDAVPTYVVGERVLVFLEPGKGGALRTAGMFFGKFHLSEGATRATDRAVRDLSGQGWIARRPAVEIEDLPLRDLLAVVSSIPYEDRNELRFRDGSFGPRQARQGSRGKLTFVAVPEEFDRLSWDDVREIGAPAPTSSSTGATGGVLSADPRGSDDPTPWFVPLSSSFPTRWDQPDTGAAIIVNIQQSGNPLNNGAAAVTEMGRAMSAWTNVPEARIVLQAGNTNYNFTGANASSPADVQPPVNIILFGDPYNDIADPVGCSGVLAIGGYWRSGAISKTVNNVSFYPATRLYVIFNNNFTCFLGTADNLAEVATHELGHGIGFGHSTVGDAIMRASAYGSGRGPRLGDDDRDAAHCTYPHTLTMTSPNGGESWQAGSVHSLSWTASSESGPDAGSVSLEYSTNGGSSWNAVVAGEPNDGSYSWTVPNTTGSQTRVRVIRPNLMSPTPAPYPSSCSLDSSNASFTITAPAIAGATPDGTNGTPLLVAKDSGGSITLTWGASCSGGASNYAVYEGNLPMMRSGLWDHLPVTCAAGTDLTETFVPGPGSRYYLIAPMASGNEGRLGQSSSGLDRPVSPAACAPREATSCP